MNPTPGHFVSLFICSDRAQDTAGPARSHSREQGSFAADTQLRGAPAQGLLLGSPSFPFLPWLPPPGSPGPPQCGPCAGQHKAAFAGKPRGGKLQLRASPAVTGPFFQHLAGPARSGAPSASMPLPASGSVNKSWRGSGREAQALDHTADVLTALRNVYAKAFRRGAHLSPGPAKQEGAYLGRNAKERWREASDGWTDA